MEIAEPIRGYILLGGQEMMNGNPPKDASKESFPTPMTVRNEDDFSKVAKSGVSLEQASRWPGSILEIVGINIDP
jgi:hypothetical protein